MMLIRFFKHLFSHPWQVKRYFSSKSLATIEQAIARSEKKHLGEIRFVVESGLHPYEILYQKTPRQRAVELFGRLNIWDTEHNNGVLIYLLLADRDVEIIADRGIHRLVGTQAWQAICHEMERMFKLAEFEAGVLYGIDSIGGQLEKYFPQSQPVATEINTQKSNRNEISDKPLVL